MSDAQQVRRAVERFQRGRRWEHSAFPTSSGGLLHTPYPRQGGGQARTAGGGGDITIGQAPIGEIVRADVRGHLSPGGEPVVWDSVLHRIGFASATFPNVELRLPHTAVYGIEGDLSWTDGFVFGGRVSLLLNGAGIPGLSPIRAGGSVDNAVGRTFTLAQEFVAHEGDRLMIMMDHPGDSHHDLEGVIEVATKEPLRVTVPTPVTPFDEVPPPSTFGSSGFHIVSVDRPAETEPGDLLVAMFGSYGGTTGIGSSSQPFTTIGWVNDGGGTGNNFSSVGAAWRRAGGSEPGSYEFTIPNGGNGVRVRLFSIAGAADPTKVDTDSGLGVSTLSLGPLTSAGSMGLFCAMRAEATGPLDEPGGWWTNSSNQRQWQAGLPPSGAWSNVWTSTETNNRSGILVFVDPA